MAIVKSKPTSPGRRGLVSVKSVLHKGKPHKSLIEPKAKNLRISNLALGNRIEY